MTPKKARARKALQLRKTATPASVQSRVTVDTVDGFQGQEYDAIVMGCGVWQQGGASGQANWEDFRRINVCLCRARMQVVLLLQPFGRRHLSWWWSKDCMTR